MLDKKKTLLVVDETARGVALAGDVGEALGFTVYSTAALDEALRLCNQRMPNFIILDLHLGEKNGGLVFLKEFKHLLGHNLVKLIMWSSVNLLEESKRAKAAGADYFMFREMVGGKDCLKALLE